MAGKDPTRIIYNYFSDDGTGFTRYVDLLEYESDGEYTDSEMETVVEHIAFPFYHYDNIYLDYYLVEISSIDDVKKLLCFCQKNYSFSCGHGNVLDRVETCVNNADENGNFEKCAFLMGFDEEFTIFENYELKSMICDEYALLSKILNAIK